MTLRLEMGTLLRVFFVEKGGTWRSQGMEELGNGGGAEEPVRRALPHLLFTISSLHP